MREFTSFFILCPSTVNLWSGNSFKENLILSELYCQRLYGKIKVCAGNVCTDITSPAGLILQDVLMNLAKAVANAAAMLVLKAKNVAQVAEDTVLQNRVIAAATQCALSTSQLVACAKVRQPACLSDVLPAISTRDR